VDGVLRAEIDTFGALPESQAVVYTLTGLATGPHVLTIEATGRRHPLSLGAAVWVDAFETLPE
jgi:deoxyinosine 3'endonuclease (endonuclease V)